MASPAEKPETTRPACSAACSSSSVAPPPAKVIGQASAPASASVASVPMDSAPLPPTVPSHSVPPAAVMVPLSTTSP